jgi:hypothetical protein
MPMLGPVPAPLVPQAWPRPLQGSRRRDCATLRPTGRKHLGHDHFGKAASHGLTWHMLTWVKHEVNHGLNHGKPIVWNLGIQILSLSLSLSPSPSRRVQLSQRRVRKKQHVEYWYYYCHCCCYYHYYHYHNNNHYYLFIYLLFIYLFITIFLSIYYYYIVLNLGLQWCTTFPWHEWWQHVATKVRSMRCDMGLAEPTGYLHSRHGSRW